MKSVFVSKKVEAGIAALRTAGKTGINLADKAMKILDSLASGTAPHSGCAIGTPTKHGEKRIKNCRKYDLGCGYRLVTVKRGETLFIPFLGTHDSCQRWLEHNSRLENFAVGSGRYISIPETNEAEMSCIESACETMNSDDDDLINYLTDKDLRSVFSGLVRGMKTQQELDRE
jgi:hypothetical protein